MKGDFRDEGEPIPLEAIPLRRAGCPLIQRPPYHRPHRGLDVREGGIAETLGCKGFPSLTVQGVG
jgi:hypothetical protein